MEPTLRRLQPAFFRVGRGVLGLGGERGRETAAFCLVWGTLGFLPGDSKPGGTRRDDRGALDASPVGSEIILELGTSESCAERDSADSGDLNLEVGATMGLPGRGETRLDCRSVASVSLGDRVVQKRSMEQWTVL